MRIYIAFLLLLKILTGQAFPVYLDLDIGETRRIDGLPYVKLLSTHIDLYDSTIERIGASHLMLDVGGEKVRVNVGYGHQGVLVGNTRVGAEILKEYVTGSERFNRRFRLEKDARIWITNANDPLLPADKFTYPLFSPWNSGFRDQGWLTVTYNIEHLEGKDPWTPGRYHDGWDFGVWESQPVRSVVNGTVVSPDDYPDFIDNGVLYNKNQAPVGTNPFLIKDPDLPVLYYYTHLGGLSKKYKAGDTIQKGEILGYASNRGSSGGWFHLHFSMIHAENGYHINPIPYLKAAYEADMQHYNDFIHHFSVYEPADNESIYDFERKILNGSINPGHEYQNIISGLIHMREVLAEHPLYGHNHVMFDRFAGLKTTFNAENEMQGELWLGHTGILRLYLNGDLVYSGENTDAYGAGRMPFQWDAKAIPASFRKGVNELTIITSQNNPFWSFSIRPRDRLGRPFK